LHIVTAAIATRRAKR